MSARTLDDQLTKYLADAHAIEEQALQQLRGAPDAAGDPELAALFREHLAETEGHERAVRERLEARDESPSKLKDLLMRVGGAGFLLFAKAQPDTPGKLVAHAFSYEHMELAAYDLLARVADRAGDRETANTARRIRAEEQRMADRLGANFDRAVDASLREVGRDDLGNSQGPKEPRPPRASAPRNEAATTRDSRTAVPPLCPSRPPGATICAHLSPRSPYRRSSIFDVFADPRLGSSIFHSAPPLRSTSTDLPPALTRIR